MVNRRMVLKAGLVAGIGLQSLNAYDNESTTENKISIARYKNPSKNPDSIPEEAERLTKAAIQALGGMSKFVSKGDVVWIKPNIYIAYPPELAVNTNPHVVAALVKLSLEAGAKEVCVSNNPSAFGSPEQAFLRSQIKPEAEKAGAKVFMMNPARFKKMAINGKFIKEWEVYQDVVEADVLINVPIVKHHFETNASLSMKNLMGVIGGQRRYFHQNLNHAIADLAAFIKPDLIVMDAIRILTRNGPFGGNPQHTARKDTVAASIDQVAADAFGATLLDQKPTEIGYVVEADSRGMGTMDFESLKPTRIDV